MILSIPCTKSKGFVSIDTDKLTDAVLVEVYLQGLKVLANRGQSKITKVTYPNEDEMKAAAQAKAEANVTDIYEGKIKFTGGKAKKASGAVMTEARRLAKNVVKDHLKQEGYKISHIEAKEITRLANELLDSDPSYVEQAKVNIEERAKMPVKIDIKTVQVSAKKVAAADAKKAKDQLSAKQAGKTKVRAKGKGAAQVSA